ncbi:hypothetical protein C8T65DRAFT_833189 [Cerioporus squamosus]|nr:hypothetical protein C8T65DRAFT_833189 [Cerioporus squamosus]
MADTYAPLKPISNGPKATHPRDAVTAPELASPGLAKAPTQDTRSCSQCRRALTPWTVYKWCEVCRQKDREKAKRKKQRALQLAAQAYASSIPATPGARSVAMDLDGADTDVEMQDTAKVVHLPPKRRAFDVGLNSEVLGAGPSHATSRREYQTEQLLLDALSQKMQEFQKSRASFSPGVIPCYVSVGRRAKQVKGELTKSAHLKFGDLIKHESTKTNTGHARTYWCACNPPPRPCPVPVQHPASQPSPTFPSLSTSSSTTPTIKRTQSTLTSWLSKPPTPFPADPMKVHTPPPGCGGTITVSVVEDLSHPLASMGIKGQRIIVRVEHPGRDVNKPFAFKQ